jgi:hypothetical protein
MSKVIKPPLDTGAAPYSGQSGIRPFRVGPQGRSEGIIHHDWHSAQRAERLRQWNGTRPTRPNRREPPAQGVVVVLLLLGGVEVIRFGVYVAKYFLRLG